MDKETMAAIREQFDEYRVKCPKVIVDAYTKHPATGGSIHRHVESEGVIAMFNNKTTLDGDGELHTEAMTMILGGISMSAAEGMVISLIDSLDSTFSGLKDLISARLMADQLRSIIEIMEGKDEDQ